MASDGEVSCTNDPNFAVICSFLKVFGELYSIEVPSLQKLQELIENTQEVLDPLRDLHIRLVRRALKSVLNHRWEKAVIRFCHQQGYHQEAWEIERFTYKKSSVQVKLKVLKVLLEYQFTCHSKFKNSINAIPSKDLRLDPLGSDKNGRVYWLQVDNDANLRLYREDQDEETWELIASNREDLVKVISQLKSGEDCKVTNGSINDDSNSVDASTEVKAVKSSEDSNEEFLSPESESEHESNDDVNQNIEKGTCNENSKEENQVKCSEDEPENKQSDEKTEESNKNSDSEDAPKTEETENQTVSEAIEEPVMIVTGDGNGADCESAPFIIGEEIIEPVMYFWGEGYGYENTAGNSDSGDGSTNVISTDEITNAASNNQVNGENSNFQSENVDNPGSNKSPRKTKHVLKSKDVNEEDGQSDSKKPCVRNKQDNNSSLDSSSNSTLNDTKDDEEQIYNDSDNIVKCVKRSNKGTSAIRKCDKTNTKVKLKIKESNSGDDTNPNVLEKRKGSFSASDHEGHASAAEEENVTENKNKLSCPLDDTLPLKKLKLENSSIVDDTSDKDKVASNISTKSISSIDVESNKEISKCDNIEYSNDDCSNINKDEESEETNVKSNIDITNRKKLKVNRLKFKKNKSLRSAKRTQKSDNGGNSDKEKTVKQPLKRSLVDTKRDKHNTDSVSDVQSEDEELGGKRLKIKQKKLKSTHKKRVNDNTLKESSTEDSDNDTLHAIGKRNGKKVLKKKSKNKNDKSKKPQSGDRSKTVDESINPVRQSRRIAQMKIKEEADRRQLEEVALRELKIKHKKKICKDDEEEWQASGASSSGGEKEKEKERRRRAGSWHSDSTVPQSDSDSDGPLYEHEEPDLVFTKSDHEFSPESDLEHDSAVPIRLARTLEEKKDDGFCVHCGKGDQPEWILLCDECDAGYHASCLKPVLFLIPEGDWYCPPCQHAKLISALDKELAKFDDLVKVVEVRKVKEEAEEAEKRKEDAEKSNTEEKEKGSDDDDDDDDSSGWTSSSSTSDGAVYRLRERRQLPVSYRAREYDRIMSSAIKEEYVEPTSSAGNQGRGKDISTIIEAAEEEKLKAEREALEQGQPIEVKKVKRKQRRKQRKLNSLDVPSEDDDEIDEDFKDTGMESTSEEISSDAEKGGHTDSGSSDSVTVRRSSRPDKKDRARIVESPEIKKKKGVFSETSAESSDTKEWHNKSKVKTRSSKRHLRMGTKKVKRKKKRKGLTQYDAEGNVIRSRVTYGGLSGAEGENDWSPKHRTRQKKINYTEMPNTESEDEMHKSSGKHMPDSSDEFKIDDSDMTSDSENDKKKRGKSVDSDGSGDEKKKEALKGLLNRTAIVPLNRLPEDVTREKTEALEAHLLAKEKERVEAAEAKAMRGRSGRGGRGSRGGRGGRRSGLAGSSADTTDDGLSKLVGVKIKGLSENFDALATPNQLEREKKRQEKEARMAEKEARKMERIQKKEEKEKMKEQKAKEREEKRLARVAMQETKKQRKESFPPMQMGYGVPPVRQPMRPEMQRMPNMYHGMPPQMVRHPGEQYQEQRFPSVPRLQVRPELRAMQPDLANVRAHRLPPPHLRPEHASPGMREGTLSVAGSPQPFKPVSDEPSIITRMPHMIPQQYRNPMMYPPVGSPYGPPPRGPPMYMHQPHPMNHPQNMVNPAQRHQYHVPGQGYYHQHIRGMPPHGYPPSSGPPAIAGTQPSVAPPIGPPHSTGSSPRTPSATPPGTSAQQTPPPAGELVTKIKSEIKTEPEFSRDNGSPSHTPTYPSPPPTKEESSRANLPKVKHTENKDRRPRFPLGPYAPQYGPYGPYAPPIATATSTHSPMDHHSQGLINLQSRPPSGGTGPHHPPPHHNLPPHAMQHYLPPGAQHPNLKQNMDPAAQPPHSHHRPLNPSPHIPRSSPLPMHETPHSNMPPRITHHQGLPAPSHYLPPHMQHQQHPPPNLSPHLSRPMRPHHPMAVPPPHHAPPPLDRSSPAHKEPGAFSHYNMVPRSVGEIHHTPPSSSHLMKQLTQPSAIPPSLLVNEPPHKPPDTARNLSESEGSISKDSADDTASSRSSPTLTRPSTDERTHPEPENHSVIRSLDPNVSDTKAADKNVILLANIKKENDDNIQRIESSTHVKQFESIEMLSKTEEPPNKSSTENEGGAPREEGSVFGGLVSYFSSQREDEMDN